MYSDCCSEPFSYVVVMVDLVVDAIYGFNQVGVDAIQPHGYPQGYMPNSVERLLEVHEDVVKVLLVLQALLTYYFKVENLPTCAPSCSETWMLFLISCNFSLIRRGFSMTLLE